MWQLSWYNVRFAVYRCRWARGVPERKTRNKNRGTQHYYRRFLCIEGGAGKVENVLFLLIISSIVVLTVEILKVCFTKRTELPVFQELRLWFSCTPLPSHSAKLKALSANVNHIIKYTSRVTSLRMFSVNRIAKLQIIFFNFWSSLDPFSQIYTNKTCLLKHLRKLPCSTAYAPCSSSQQRWLITTPPTGYRKDGMVWYGKCRFIERYYHESL